MNIKHFYFLEKLFKENGFKLYLVGGAPRDILLKKDISDFDMVSDALVKDMMSFYDGVDTSFEKYGSARLILDGEEIEITTLRKEEYADQTRIPSKITYVKSIEEDYLRRDFTINAIYMDGNNNYYDFCGGIEDLNKRIIRMIGDPNIRFKEDPLRILRCLRFSIQLGFDIEENLSKSIYDNLYLLGTISYTLINKELKKMREISMKKYMDICNKYNLEDYIILDYQANHDQYIIDLHVDTITKAFDQDKRLFKNDLQVDIKKMYNSNYLLQVFAIFLNKKKNHDYQTALNYIDFYKKEIKNNSNLLHQVCSYNDFINAKSLKKLGAILSIEESGILDGDLNRLEELYNLGVRMMTLTWNYPNEIGYPNVDLTDMNNIKLFNYDQGLTHFGYEVVKKMNELGIIIDVSHLSDKGFYDVLNISSMPVVASHSNSRVICNHPRNLTDDMILKLHEKRGLMGINYCDDFVRTNDEEYVSSLIKHIKHIKELGCLDVICLGSDFDGIKPREPLSSCLNISLLKDALLKENFSKNEIDMIFYKNFIRLMKKVLK